MVPLVELHCCSKVSFDVNFRREKRQLQKKHNLPSSLNICALLASLHTSFAKDVDD